jgi:hypothetical protein
MGWREVDELRDGRGNLKRWMGDLEEICDIYDAIKRGMQYPRNIPRKERNSRVFKFQERSLVFKLFLEPDM